MWLAPIKLAQGVGESYADACWANPLAFVGGWPRLTTMVREANSYRSRVDGAEAPYLVSYPQSPPNGGRLPLVVWLHDTLPDASPTGFLEQAYKTAAEWAPTQEKFEPSVVLQPYGRGNAGWVGWGGVDFLEAFRRVQQSWAIDPDRVYLVGVGSGGTGALQWAGFQPHLFAGVAACAPWTDLDRYSIADRNLAVERDAIRSLAPMTFAGNLAWTPCWLEYPRGQFGLPGFTSVEHTRRMLRKLRAIGAPVVEPATGFVGIRQAARPFEDRTTFWNWLLRQRRSGKGLSRITYPSLRWPNSAEVHVLQMSNHGRPARVWIDADAGCSRVRTRNCDGVAVRLDASRSVVLDGQEFTPDAWTWPASAPVAWLTFARVATRWRFTGIGSAAPNAGLEPLATDEPGRPWKSSAGAGPMMDVRWGGVVLVPGTLGDDAENRVNLALAQQIAEQWTTGADSLNLFPGDRRTNVEFPIRADGVISDSELRTKNLLLIGRRQSHLLLRRLRLPFDWPEEDGSPKRQTNSPWQIQPGEWLVFVYPNPEAPSRLLQVVTAGDVESLAQAWKLPTALLPDYVFANRRGVVRSGYFAADWGRTWVP